MPCRPKHDPKCGPGHIAHRAEILGTARPSCSCRASTAQNISCRAMLWVVPNDHAAAHPKMARPKSQLYLYIDLAGRVHAINLSPALARPYRVPTQPWPEGIGFPSPVGDTATDHQANLVVRENGIGGASQKADPEGAPHDMARPAGVLPPRRVAGDGPPPLGGGHRRLRRATAAHTPEGRSPWTSTSSPITPSSPQRSPSKPRCAAHSNNFMHGLIPLLSRFVYFNRSNDL